MTTTLSPRGVLLALSAALLWSAAAAAEPLSQPNDPLTAQAGVPPAGGLEGDEAARETPSAVSVTQVASRVGAVDPAGVDGGADTAANAGADSGAVSGADAVALPAKGLGPAPLAPPPQRLGEMLDIEPDPPGVSVVLPPTIAGLSGCGLVSAPLGTIGFASAIAGLAAVVGVLGAGLTPVIGVPLFAGGFCLGLPAFCVMGPASVGAAAGGAMIATRTYNDRSGLPALIAMIPPLLLAFAGSGLATVGLFYTLGALLAISAGGGRAGLAMMSAGLLTSLLAGPLAAFLAVGADVAFGGPFEEGLAGQINDALTFGHHGPQLSEHKRTPPRHQVAMAF